MDSINLTNEDPTRPRMTLDMPRTHLDVIKEAGLDYKTHGSKRHPESDSSESSPSEHPEVRTHKSGSKKTKSK